MDITNLECKIPLLHGSHGILPIQSYSSMVNSVLGKLYLLLGSLPYLGFLGEGSELITLIIPCQYPSSKSLKN